MHVRIIQRLNYCRQESNNDLHTPVTSCCLFVYTVNYGFLSRFFSVLFICLYRQLRISFPLFVCPAVYLSIPSITDFLPSFCLSSVYLSIPSITDFLPSFCLSSVYLSIPSITDFFPSFCLSCYLFVWLAGFKPLASCNCPGDTASYHTLRRRG